MCVLCRAGRANPSLRCVLMELSRTPQTDSCSCAAVQTFTAGSSCKLLTKNAVFKSPAGEGATLVCAGDEATNSTMVRDAPPPVQPCARVSHSLSSVFWFRTCSLWSLRSVCRSGTPAPVLCFRRCLPTSLCWTSVPLGSTRAVFWPLWPRRCWRCINGSEAESNIRTEIWIRLSHEPNTAGLGRRWHSRPFTCLF